MAISFFTIDHPIITIMFNHIRYSALPLWVKLERVPMSGEMAERDAQG